MEFSEVLLKRRSIRKFVPGEKTRDDDLKLILTAAMCAPSACNTRPWEFYVIEDEKIKAGIAEIKPQVKNASAVVVVCGFPERQVGASEGFWQQDCGAAIENMLLKATDLGIGSCWCGIYPKEEKVKAVKQLLGSDSTPLAVVVFGKADEEPEQRGFYEKEKVIVK